MAQELAQKALALSPARAASPADAEFEAIREAFLETARGRWFLDEYTRRNRNADTAMVLEAVTRIEQALAAPKDEPQPAAEPPVGAHPGALAAVGAIIAAARDDAVAALAGPVLDDALAPARKCARVIREIAWGLRESGADGRICTLLDTQVDAINTACDRFASGGLRDAVTEVFDRAAQQIDGLAAPSNAVIDDGLFDRTEAADTAAATIVVAIEADAAPPADTTAQADPDPVLPEDQNTAAHVHVVAMEVTPAETAPDSMTEGVAVTTTETTVETAADTMAATSLGASLIASGIVARPASPQGDPLAAIRRMSQAEKVAFFS